MTVINMKDHIPVTDVADFTLSIDSDGVPILCLTWASAEFIEKHDSVSDRFTVLGELIVKGAKFLDESAENFKED